jgi:hypothetical protein
VPRASFLPNLEVHLNWKAVRAQLGDECREWRMLDPLVIVLGGG